jgi:putative FmdB family regulatory protein
MPTYGYACGTCGAFDVMRPMAADEEPALCPRCGATGRRVFGGPGLRSMQPGLRRALDAQHRSTDAPEVSTTLPPRTGRVQRRVTDPRQARLPRP